MRAQHAAAALFFIFSLLPNIAYAANFGPFHEVAEISAQARRLLANRVRITGVDPKAISISDVVVVNDQALLSWDSGKQHGLMGLVLYLDRWWDALDAYRSPYPLPTWAVFAAFPLQPYYNTVQTTHDVGPKQLQARGLSSALVAQALMHNTDVAQSQASASTASRTSAVDSRAAGFPVLAPGAVLSTLRQNTAGYEITITYSKNDAGPAAVFTQLYGRAPTQTEMLQNPPPPTGFGGPTDVFYFDLAVSAPVAFTPGTKIDIWFPFVLDDALSYRLSYVMDGKFSQSFHGTIFDNVLHFELPAFAIIPPDNLQTQVEGFW